MDETIKIDCVDQYNKLFGLETLHPLVSVVDLSKIRIVAYPFSHELWSIQSFFERYQMWGYPIWSPDV